MSGVVEPPDTAEVRRFPTYPAYKKSGIEGLEEMPADWEVRKATWLFTIGSGTTPSDDPIYYGGQIPWITTSELRESIIKATEKTVTEKALQDFPSLKMHAEGSIAVAMYGATIGRLGILGIPATVNQACCVFSNPKGIEARFWFYWLQMRRAHLISLGYGGGQPNLSQALLRSLRVPTPSFGEQQKIAAFLDREIEKIDASVSKKERLIELLREKRAAFITRAVTKGLDPKVSMKDSGVAWLGEVPAHWDARPLKYFLSAPLAYGVLKPDRYSGEDGVRLIRILDVEAGEVDEETLEIISPEQSQEFGRTLVRTGDVVVSVVGTIGRAFVVPESLEGANLSRALARIQLKPTLLPAFLEYCIASHSFVSFVDLISAGTAQRVLNLSDLKNFSMAAPPETEQLSIVALLDRETARFDLLIAKIRNAMGRLQEMRAALIAAAVTGTIDVREHAA